MDQRSRTCLKSGDRVLAVSDIRTQFIGTSALSDASQPPERFLQNNIRLRVHRLLTTYILMSNFRCNIDEKLDGKLQSPTAEERQGGPVRRISLSLHR